MAREFQVGTIRLTSLALNDTHTINLSGFTGAPNYMRFWICGRDSATDAAGNASHDRGYGYAISAGTRFAIGSQSTHGSGNAQADSILRDDCVLALLDHAAAAGSDGRVDISSVSSSQIVLINDEALGHAITVGYVVGRVNNVALGTITEPGSTGTQSVSGLGFTPKIVHFASAHSTAVNTLTADSRWMVGAGISSSEMYALCGGSNDAAGTSDTNSYNFASECIALLNATASATDGRAEFDSLDADGFQINWLERTSTRLVVYMAVGGGDWQLDHFTSSTVATTTIARSGYGFAPDACVVFGLRTLQSTQDTVQAGDHLSVGAASSTSNRWALSAIDQDAQNTMVVVTGIEYDAVHLRLGAGPVDGLIDINSFDSDGITYIQDDADPGSGGEVYTEAVRFPDMNRKARVSGYEFEVPDANRRARISGYEFEVPDAPRRARVSGFEFEVPDAPRRARVSGFEFEVPDFVVDRRARISGFEFEVPDAPRRARVSGFEFEVPDVGGGGFAGGSQTSLRIGIGIGIGAT